MDAMVKKYQNKYRRVKDEMAKWDDLQSHLLSQFANASAIIGRLQMLMETKNYGGLSCVRGVKETLVGKQMEALEMTFMKMKETMNDFNQIVKCFGKISRDSNQLLRGGSSPSTHQMQLRIGIYPSLEICLNGLKTIFEMHQSEYVLKSSVISALTFKSSSNDITALRQLLVDQPNIPKDEVQLIFDIIFAEEIS